MPIQPQFHHYELVLLNPAFDSPLVDVVTDLEHLRRMRVSGSTPQPMFLQLKHVFHFLESLGSARIEGNHTTLADLVESRLEAAPAALSDALNELANIEQAMAYIEAELEPGQVLSEHFIRELHALTVRGLQREGDDSPGAYRRKPVRIAQSAHLPPEAMAVPQYMAELVQFINRGDAPKYDLIKVALAHHRFAWVHPFGNGNGRVVRLLTYALLIKYGFNVKADGRLLNPTAIFCNDRERYYTLLGQADDGSLAGREAWCTYVLRGMLVELQKLARLADAGYLLERILIPALQHARQREQLTPLEERLLREAARLGVAKTSELATVAPGLSERQRTYQVGKLVERGLLMPLREGARQYTLGFVSSVLLRGVVQALAQEGFIPEALQRA